MSEKEQKFADRYHRINSITEFEYWYNNVPTKRNLIFRGTNEAKYKMFTSLQRQYLDGKVDEARYSQKDFMANEIDRLRNGKVLPVYYKELGVPVTDYLYMSFLQHYGAPTSFLDFSTDAKVSLYFASDGVKYCGCGLRRDNISNYVSLYWMERDRAKIPSIYEKILAQCLEVMFRLLRDREFDSSKDGIRKFALHFMSWAKLSEMPLGFIDGDNNARFNRLFTPDGNIEQLYRKVETFLMTGSRSAGENLMMSVRFIFSQAVVIANLNQVAQKGCFIHYLPSVVSTPLEDYPVGENPLPINCLDIHKSLILHIQKKIIPPYNSANLFPEARKIAEQSYKETIE